MRPEEYQYLDIIYNHVGNDLSRIFNEELIYPRQLEVHLPGNNTMACNFHCFYCQGRMLKQPLGCWEEKGLKIMEQLKGKIPFYIYGGAYTEPLLNPFLLDYLKMTKKYDNNFGIHTNGSLLLELEEKNKFCSTLVDLATSHNDYISISLDGGCTNSHCKIKNVSKDWFSEIIEGIKLLVKLRGRNTFPSIRVCYLMNNINSGLEEIEGIVNIMKEIKVDSLRFSVPYDLYGKSFDQVKNYRNNFEIPFGDKCQQIVEPFVSCDVKEKPLIFWHSPLYQDVEKMDFEQCIYSYYQITFAADGNVYRCSSTASPSFAHSILGEITDDLAEFNKMVLANHNKDWDPHVCFKSGARCNRIALEINQDWSEQVLSRK